MVVSDSEPSIKLQSRNILRRAREMQAQLETFGEHLATVYNGYFQEFPQRLHIPLYNDLVTEIALLEKEMGSDDPLSSHRISSSNLPYWHAVWDVAKNSKDIVKLRHPVFSGPFKHRILAPGIRVRDIVSSGGSEPKRKQFRPSMRIDVICDGGLSWYKVSTLTNRRLLFDMAKEAMYCGDSDDSDSAEGVAQNFSDVPLVKLALSLKMIAQGHQIRNTSPTPNLVLPRVLEGECAEVDKIVKLCRDLGVNVLCRGALTQPPPFSKGLLYKMVPSPKRHITEELNIDTSVLVALASDISHFQVTKESWLGQSQKDHVDLEATDPLMPKLCSLLSNHALVCTREAANALARIVHTMGTATENARAHLLLTPEESMTCEQRVIEFRALSIHGEEIPLSLQLPIRVVDFEGGPTETGSQNLSNAPVYDHLEVLPQPGRSVFSFGWAKNITTVTCNTLAVKQLEKRLEELPSLDPSKWPSIWAFSSSRPLVGVRKGSDEPRLRKHIGDCRSHCVCGLNEFSKN
ncbi:hypothetical protein ONZ43_g2553 [Nemania bipapillata]|uniref:Uncharacterized protein n=1 Tax=Nemania bipapillata TaxID=110536 RepID=A0ACC2J075_9PEZI|nr:hypothetical protein ONZ43_g2553 [Nemania bipapillata]